MATTRLQLVMARVLLASGFVLLAACATRTAGVEQRMIVPAGTARLRISITLNIGEADIAALAETIGRLRR